MADLDMFMVGFAYVISCSTVALWMLDEWEEEEAPPDVDELANAVAAFRRFRKRAYAHTVGEEDEGNEEPPTKKKKFDYERAHRCIQQDYLGPHPLHEKQFDRIFRVTRGAVERPLDVCALADEYFTHRDLVTKEPGMWPEAKVLMALKTLAYGCSSSAFIDYFQMGLTSGKDTLERFCKVIANSELKDQYLRQLTREDARRITAMHKRVFGVAGCVGCLDCMHVYWKNCPVAWQGQHQGKEGSASVVLEALGDCTTWIWNFNFGFPGTLNDINMWEQSTLLMMFLSGGFTNEVDFPCRIGNKVFQKLFLLVDGMCPELSRFVKTFSVPLTKQEKDFAEWQEASRKSIERAFGIAQRKFQILCRPVELWCEDEIKDVVTTCFILHNMMVEVRINRDEQEKEDWYATAEDTADEEEEDDDEDEFIARHSIDSTDDNTRAPKPDLETRMSRIRQRWPHACPERKQATKEAIGSHFEEVNREWRDLCDAQQHLDLRQAIMTEVASNKTK